MKSHTEGMARAALGLRAHSGWAALVAVGGSPRSPAVIDRRRIELADPLVPGSRQPYHAAEGLNLTEAKKVVSRCATGARVLARRAVRATIYDLRKKGHQVVCCGILLAAGRSAASLAATLASHALIHTADGELFRDALGHAIEHCALPMTGVRERDLYTRATADLGLPTEGLRQRVAELGRAIGPPWRRDEKLAALVAWVALACASEPSVR